MTQVRISTTPNTDWAMVDIAAVHAAGWVKLTPALYTQQRRECTQEQVLTALKLFPLGSYCITGELLLIYPEVKEL